MLNIGYACLTLGVPGTQLKTCRLTNASYDTLASLTARNLGALEAMLSYNIREGISLFRISSDLIPFASHPDINFPWRELFEARLQELGDMIRLSGMRVSMHPGQYTLLNSKDADVTARAIADIRYHAALLDALGTNNTHKIVLHLGGVYGDKAESMRRFRTHFLALDPDIWQRIVIENDDKHYHIGDVLETAAALNIPAVFDNLHHRINSCGGAEADWIAACTPTWDSRQKVHYSQQAVDKRPGAHSQTIQVDEFIRFIDNIKACDLDVMLEVKDKNLSVLKCLLCTAEKEEISRLEREWSRYKYTVLARDPMTYTLIRELFKDKNAYPAKEFYNLVEAALDKPFHAGHARNAAQHVWGYFSEVATSAERKMFMSLTENFCPENARRAGMLLHRLTEKYQVSYLANSYYFIV